MENAANLLIVEDDPEVAEILATSIHSKGCQVAMAGCGEDREKLL